MSQVDTTSENPESPAMIQPIYHNAPEDLDAAIKRILELELRLEDLHRAAEIAVAVRDFTLIEGQMPEADKALSTKIVVEYPNSGHQPITVITGTYDPAKAGITGAGTP
jgi:hypothetical protein